MIPLLPKIKIKVKTVQPSDTAKDDVDYITPQFRHIKELSQLKYDAEEKREQHLIQQSGQMQTAFSFVTAAVFMAIPICIEYRGPLSLCFFLVSVSVISGFLILSLLFASIAQWRWKTKSFPDVSEIKSGILNSQEWQKFCIEYHQIDQWINLVGEVQEEKAHLNDRRVKLIIASMLCFYASIGSVIVSFIVGMIKMF